METENLLIQQNNLLQRQNDLIEQNNLLLQQQNKILQRDSDSSDILSNNEEFVEKLYKDEMRSGFLVTSHKKRLWNVEIGLINEFARICEKHNLRYFAAYGTLLGAARHKGFIPWDDDVDLIMLRPDYEKFKKVAVDELKYPYYFDAYYDYRFEGYEISSPDESNLPFIKFEDRRDSGGAWPFFPLLKIRDSRTTFIEYPHARNIHQGVWIDIFPVDPVPPFNNNNQNVLFNVERELYTATFNPRMMAEVIKNKVPLISSVDSMNKFLGMTYRQKALFFESFCAEHFSESEYVNQLRYNFADENAKSYKAKYFDEVIYLPFEKIELPCPTNYDEILTVMYGNWHQMIFTHSHAQIWSVDIPYTEYYKNAIAK